MNDQSSIARNSRATPEQLPARVVKEIVAHQNAGKRLVGWFQLMFPALFGFLYAVAPKAVSTEKNYEKIVIILTVTAIMALAIYRARRLLVNSVVEETAARDLSRFFSPEIARRITASDQEISVGHRIIKNRDVEGVAQPQDIVVLAP